MLPITLRSNKVKKATQINKGIKILKKSQKIHKISNDLSYIEFINLIFIFFFYCCNNSGCINNIFFFKK